MGDSGLRLRYERGPDFFRFLSMQGEDFRVFLGEEPREDRPPTQQAERSVHLVATFSHRMGYIDGVAQSIGYLGDFRVHRSRKLPIIWRKAYADLIRNTQIIDEIKNCTRCITAVIDENTPAMRALVEPKKKTSFRYIPIDRYRTVSILGKLPWSRLLHRSSLHSRTLRARRAEKGDRVRLLAFLDRNAKLRPYGFPAEIEMARRERTWPEFSIESFWLTENRDGEILCAFAPWSPSPAKRIIIDRLPSGSAFTLWLAKLFGFYTPRLQEELQITTLTWLETEARLSLADKQSVFRFTLDSFFCSSTPGYRFNAQNSMIAFCDFDQEPLIGGLSGYITQQIPMTLYEVTADQAKTQAQTERLRPSGFEIALV